MIATQTLSPTIPREMPPIKARGRAHRSRPNSLRNPPPNDALGRTGRHQEGLLGSQPWSMGNPAARWDAPPGARTDRGRAALERTSYHPRMRRLETRFIPEPHPPETTGGRGQIGGSGNHPSQRVQSLLKVDLDHPLPTIGIEGESISLSLVKSSRITPQGKFPQKVSSIHFMIDPAGIHLHQREVRKLPSNKWRHWPMLQSRSPESLPATIVEYACLLKSDHAYSDDP